MGPKKGLSRDEKKKRALEFFYEKKEPFTLKELESQLHKQKGIVSQSVKEIIQELVSDGMVDSDKIGSGNFFWALPSKAAQMRKLKIEQQTKALADLKERHATADQKLQKAQVGRAPSKARDDKLARITELKQQQAAMALEMQKYSSTDPERVKELQKHTKAVQEHAARWNDNVCQGFKHFKKHNESLTAKAFAEEFGLPPDFEDG